MTPDTVQRIATLCSTLGNENNPVIREWILTASPRDLMELISAVHHSNNWHQFASQVVQQKSIVALTEQTRNQVELTKTLTQQTEILIKESKGLRMLTWGLLILTAALLYIDWHREHKPEITVTRNK